MSEGFWLQIEEDGEERRVRLSGSETSIGRDADNAIVVHDRRSSRRHCRLVVSPDGLILEDLGSRNGTILKGTTVTKSHVEVGDEFHIGKTRFTVRSGSMPDDDGSASAASARSAPRTDSDRRGETFEDEDSGDVASVGEQSTLAETREVSRSSSGVEAGAGEEAEADAAQEAASEPTGNRDAERPGTSSGGRVDTAQRSGETEVVLECLAGARRGEKIRVSNVPFGIGRRSANDLSLKDQRASGQHARILREGELYYIEDQGSRNGTYLNRRPVTRGLLTPGSVVHIGAHKFRVHVPRSAALAEAVKSSPEDAARNWAGDEDLGRFEVEAFEGAARSEHPLAVVVIVLILGVICYFSVDVARRVLIRPPLDPPAGDNDLGEHWSFEAPVPEGADKVPGWAALSRHSDSCGLRVGRESAQYPGRQALHLSGGAEPGTWTRAVFEPESPLAVRAGARYRVAGFVRNQSAFAAGFVVDWAREVDGERVVVGRSFSETARERGEVLNVAQVVTAPASATRAWFSCFLLGGNARGVFDRVVFAPLAAEPDAAERAPDLTIERVYRFGTGDDADRAGTDPLRLTLSADGTMSLARGRRLVLPRLWLGLAPDADPGQYGSRLATPRVLTEDEGSLSFVAQLPDVVNETWATVEASLFVAATELTLRLRGVSGRERETDSPRICLYFEPRDPAVALRFPGSGEEGSLARGKIPSEAQEEMILGDRGGQVVFGFSPGASLSHVEHSFKKGPDGTPRRILVARGRRRGDFALRVSTTSRLEKEATLRIVRQAESLYRAGRVGEAVELLERVPARFPEQTAEIELAAARAASWRREGNTAVDDLQHDLASLLASSSPVLYDLLLERAAGIERRFEGLAPATRASQLAGEARKFWEGEATKRKDEQITSLYEQGRAFFLDDRIGLAKLYLSRVVELGAGTNWARQAKITLDSIDKRRREQRASLLR